MERYEISDFIREISLIEQFLIEIAANEERISLNGFQYALALPAYDFASPALERFQQSFSNLRRFMASMDKTFFSEMESLESSGKVIEELALINLRLRMAKAATLGESSIAIAKRIFNSIPFFPSLSARKSLFGETQISLQRTIINLARLRTVVSMFEEYVFNRKFEDDEIFKPSNISADRVVELIDKAIAELDSETSIPEIEVKRLKGYLFEAKKEVLAKKPSWEKVVGALVIVAAVTSGLADAPGAAKTVKDVLEYVVGTSVLKPLKLMLPDQRIPAVPINVSDSLA